MNRNHEGETGHLLEERVWGAVRVDARHSESDEHLTFGAAMELVRKNQPPIKAPYAARLWKEVCQRTGKPVKFFTAVRSMLDERHKVDGWFELEGKVVTFDFTMIPEKPVKTHMRIESEELKDVAGLAGRIAREIASISQLPGRV